MLSHIVMYSGSFSFQNISQLADGTVAHCPVRTMAPADIKILICKYFIKLYVGKLYFIFVVCGYFQAGHSYVSQNQTPQPRPHSTQFASYNQYRAAQHGTRPNAHPRYLIVFKSFRSKIRTSQSIKISLSLTHRELSLCSSKCVEPSCFAEISEPTKWYLKNRWDLCKNSSAAYRSTGSRAITTNLRNVTQRYVL